MDNNIKIIKVEEEGLKKEISRSILDKLPKWFGIEEAKKEYIEESSNMNFFAAYHDEDLVGFVAIKINSTYTAEIYVMGIDEEYHRRGIGRRLFNEVYNWCKLNRFEFLQVKTLDEENKDKNYAKTREFYKSLGFKTLEVFKTLWDENNPCLVMVMSVK